MKFLVVFACILAVTSAGYLAPVAPVAVVAQAQHLPVIGPNGVPIDEPAVQHARAAHLGHKVEAHVRNGDYSVVAPAVVSAPVVASTYAATPLISAHPAAYPTSVVQPTSLNGVPLETPEVVAAKSAHFAAHGEALARTGHVASLHHLYKRGIYAAAPVAAYSTPYVAGLSTYATHSPLVAATSYANSYGYGYHPYAYTPYARYY